MDFDKLQRKAQEIREKTIDIAYKVGKCHIGGSLSTIEILSVLYYGIMKVDPQNPSMDERDRFILSKGHGALSLYVILADLGFYPEEALVTYKKFGSILQGHPDKNKTPGIEMSAGSLGQGISYGVGKALGLRLKKLKSRVFVMVGDGELQEGQNWEAIQSAYHYNLDNLTMIVDYNGLQLDDTVEKEISFGNLASKLSSFGWNASYIDGHDIKEIYNALLKEESKYPTAIIANTVKGKGISFMENQTRWHCDKMTEDEYIRAKNDLLKVREKANEST